MLALIGCGGRSVEVNTLGCGPGGEGSIPSGHPIKFPAPVAQRIRASGFEPEGRGFDSLRACQSHIELSESIPLHGTPIGHGENTGITAPIMDESRYFKISSGLVAVTFGTVVVYEALMGQDPAPHVIADYTVPVPGVLGTTQITSSGSLSS